MSNEYKPFFGACLPCKKLYRSRNIHSECPKCSKPLTYTIYTEDEKERQQYVLQAKMMIRSMRQSYGGWDSHPSFASTQFSSPAKKEPPKKIEIPKLSFKIKMRYEFQDRTKLVRIRYRFDRIILEVSTECAIKHFNDTEIIQQELNYRKVDYLRNILFENNLWREMKQLLVGRDEIIGFIPQARNNPPEVYISPDFNDYHEMIKDILREDKKRQDEQNKIWELRNQELRREEEVRKQKMFAGRQHAYELHKKQHSGLFSFIFGAPKMRSTHCYRCETALFSSTHKDCSICKWLICRCGACGCQYNKF